MGWMPPPATYPFLPMIVRRRDGRVAEGARLESVFRGNSNVGSNPTLSASSFAFTDLAVTFDYCGNPTFRTSSANRGSERMGSSVKSVLKRIRLILCS